ncbi:hypothetical protein [Thermomonospora umbrina]|uniref:hypothetical protein n=1 Tax=Thermomonospora umbrina TaxID=111806 RepID=UPI000E22E032|nr:hypothetical protein [Thermomonospora umbrina]
MIGETGRAGMADLAFHLCDHLDRIIADTCEELAGRRAPDDHRFDLAVDSRAPGILRGVVVMWVQGEDAPDVLDVFERVGVHEARTGRDLRELHRSVCAGGRVLMRWVVKAAEELGLPAPTLCRVADNAFECQAAIMRAAAIGYRRALSGVLQD